MPKRSASKAKPAPDRSVELVIKDSEAKEIRITGDFMGWLPGGVPLRKGPGGTWIGKLQLAPGEYQYRLIVDGEWRNNPEAGKRVPNSYGSENDILTVAD